MRSILPGERDPVSEIEPALQLRRRALRAEGHLEPARDERQLRHGLVTHELLQIAAQALLELPALELGHLHPDARERPLEALVQERERLVQPRLLDAIAADRLRQPTEEAVERRVRDRPTEHRVDLAVDLLRVDQPLEEPGGGAVREALELGDVERASGRELGQHPGMGQLRSADERLSAPARAGAPSRSRPPVPLHRPAASRQGGQATAAARARSVPARSPR